MCPPVHKMSMIPYVIVLLCCSLYVLGDSWQTQLRERNKGHWLNRRKQEKWNRGRNTENIQAAVSSRTNKHSAELFDHCPDLIHCPTCKSLVAGFTEAVKLRKTPAPRVRELQNPLPPPMESHIPVHRTLLSASQQAGQKGRAKRSSQNSWRNKRSGSCCAMIASQPNAPWSTAGAFHLIWSVRKSHSTNSWLQHFMEGRRDTSCIVQITQI